MNAYPSNRVSESDRSTKAGLLRPPVFAIALIAGGLSISTARADNTLVQANMTFPATASCDLDNCTSASGSVSIAVNLDDCPELTDMCPLDVNSSFDVDCAPSNNEPGSLTLYETETADCAGEDTTVDLLAAPELSRLKWDEMAKAAMSPRALGGWVIVADLGPLDAGGNAIASGNPRAIGIPTLSEWAVVLMTLVLIVAGTILFGRSRRRARTA